MIMPIENEMRRVKVLKITSYLLLLAGVLLVIPYPTFHILKIIRKKWIIYIYF